ncbi:MAG TPA: hypothetical protein PKH77_23230 [Anaerolineae bacterium]|nr:hypothetical protein [Anaerolineae bacterium]
MDSQHWVLWLTLVGLVVMAFLIPTVAIRRVVRVTRKINGLSTLMQQAHQLTYLKLTPVWSTSAAIFVQGVLGLLGTGLIGAAIYVRSVSNVALYWPLILLGSGGLLGIALVKNPFEKFREARRLDREGVAVTTPLLACFEGAADGDMTFYVAYALPGVGPIRHPVAYRIFKRVKAGDPITVVYHPQSPRLFRPRWR